MLNRKRQHEDPETSNKKQRIEEESTRTITRTLELSQQGENISQQFAGIRTEQETQLLQIIHDIDEKKRIRDLNEQKQQLKEYQKQYRADAKAKRQAQSLTSDPERLLDEKKRRRAEAKAKLQAQKESLISDADRAKSIAHVAAKNLATKQRKKTYPDNLIQIGNYKLPRHYANETPEFKTAHEETSKKFYEEHNTACHRRDEEKKQRASIIIPTESSQQLPRLVSTSSNFFQHVVPYASANSTLKVEDRKLDNNDVCFDFR